MSPPCSIPYSPFASVLRPGSALPACLPQEGSALSPLLPSFVGLLSLTLSVFILHTRFVLRALIYVLTWHRLCMPLLITTNTMPLPHLFPRAYGTILLSHLGALLFVSSVPRCGETRSLLVKDPVRNAFHAREMDRSDH